MFLTKCPVWKHAPQYVKYATLLHMSDRYIRWLIMWMSFSPQRSPCVIIFLAIYCQTATMPIKSSHYLGSVVDHEFKATVQIKWANVSWMTQISHATTIFVLNITSRTFQTVLMPAVSKLGVIGNAFCGRPMLQSINSRQRHFLFICCFPLVYTDINYKWLSAHM